MKYVPPTSEKLVLIHPLATVVSRSSGYVRIDWQVVPMESEKVRALFQLLLVLLRHTRHTKVLTDHSAMPPFWPADCLWLFQQWAPRAAAQAGCTHIAVVESTEALRQDYRAGFRQLAAGPARGGALLRLVCRCGALAQVMLNGWPPGLWPIDWAGREKNPPGKTRPPAPQGPSRSRLSSMADMCRVLTM